MRILIPNHFPLEGSGSGIYTQNVAREVTLQGHNALVITPGHNEQRGFPFEARTILFSSGEDEQGESINRERLPFNFPCFTTHPLSNTTFADLDDGQRAAYVKRWQSAIESAVSEWQPDIIHAQHLWVTGYAAHQTGVPYVATAHGTDLMGFRKYDAWKGMALEGARNARAIISISHQVSGDVEALYKISDEKVRLIWNGFDQNIFHTKTVQREELIADLGLAINPDYVVSFVGKLTDFKGVDVLLDAAAIYERQLGNVATLIVGDGLLRANLTEQARRLQLSGVHFLGHQNQTDVASIFNLADVSVVPSRVEPFGLVAVEALACGTPVVATNEGGLPDFVNEQVGVLVDVGDVQALGDAIIAEIKTEAKKRKGSFAASYALEHFSWAGQVDKMLAVYNEVLNASH